MHRDWRRPFAGLHVEGCSRAGGYPEATPFPAAVRVVDAAVDPFRVGPHRIRHADGYPLSILERQVTIGFIPCRNRRIVAEAERVALIDPCEIAAFRAP